MSSECLGLRQYRHGSDVEKCLFSLSHNLMWQAPLDVCLTSGCWAAEIIMQLSSFIFHQVTKEILTYSLWKENWRKPPGRPRTTWMNTIQQDLKSNNLYLKEAIDLPQNRPLFWLMSPSGACHKKEGRRRNTYVIGRFWVSLFLSMFQLVMHFNVSNAFWFWAL